MIKILVIDDEEEVLKTIALVLQSAGYHAVKAANGEEGIKAFNEFSFDMVITDFFMPLANGDEVARHVRNAGKGVPIIGMTGTPEEMDRTCFDKVLEKPFLFEELIKSIKSFEKN
jgi:DNA-binding response OmpR family regulator